jgi:hypothetical protein
MQANKKISKKQKTLSLTSKGDGKIVRLIHRTIQMEKQLKWYDVYQTAFSVSDTFSAIDMTGIGIGTTPSQRVGSSALIKSIRMAGSWVTGDATQLCRLVIFKWIPSNSSDTPSLAELCNATSATTQIVVSGLLQYKPSRFKILSDKLFALDTLAHPIKKFEYTVHVNSVVTFDTGGNTGRDHIYLWYSSDSTVAPSPTLTYSFQVKFSDTE